MGTSHARKGQGARAMHLFGWKSPRPLSMRLVATAAVVVALERRFVENVGDSTNGEYELGVLEE